MAKNKGMVAGQAGAKSKAPTKLTFTAKMTFKKETPGTYAYEVQQAEGQPRPPVSSIYVAKDHVTKKYDNCVVTVVLE